MDVQSITLLGRKDIQVQYTCAKCGQASGWLRGFIEVKESRSSLPMAKRYDISGGKLEASLLKKVGKAKTSDANGRVNEVPFWYIKTSKKGTRSKVQMVTCPHCGKPQRYFNTPLWKLIVSAVLFFIVCALILPGLVQMISAREWLGSAVFGAMTLAGAGWFFFNVYKFTGALGSPKAKHQVVFDWLDSEEVYGEAEIQY